MEIRSVLVIGGSGFIGSHIIAKMEATGCRVTVPTRRVSHAQHLLLLSAVDDLVEADVHDPIELDRLIEGKDAVINLVGTLHGKSGSSRMPYDEEFARVHVQLPRMIADACARHRVRRLLHMSALGASKDAPSMYLRSKADGEAAVRSNPELGATVFRPSVVFGDNDHFLNLFASLQRMMPVMMLAGAETKFQPVYVEDVAQAFVTALHNERTIGRVYELAGPKVYTLRELVQLAGEYSGHPRMVIGLPKSMARMQAFLLEHMPGEPLMSRDNLDSMKIDNVAHAPIAEELGITPTALEAVAPYYLRGERPHSGVDTGHMPH